jgi:hypothetical protein
MKKSRFTSKGVVGHAKNGEAVGSFDVKNVTIMGIRGIAISYSLLWSFQNLPRYCTRIRWHGAELRQHHVAPGQHAIEYPHLCLSDCKDREWVRVSGFGETESWVWTLDSNSFLGRTGWNFFDRNFRQTRQF